MQKTSFLNYDPAGRATLIRPVDSISANGFAHDVAVTYAGARSVARTVKIGQTLTGGAVFESPATTTEIYDRQECVKLFSYAVQNGTGDYKNGKLFQSIRYNYPVLGGTQYQAFITETYHYGGVEGHRR